MKPKVDLRLPALRRFAIAITALTVLGHSFLGFEQSVAHVFIALLTGYTLEILLEWIDAHAHGRKPRFIGDFKNLVDFLLPVHIGSLAVAMLLYPNEQLFPISFAVSVLVGSKYIFRVHFEKGSRHFLNPSNTGIATTLIVFPWVGIAPPYMFTENLYGFADWLLPLVIIISGTFLNTRFTKRMPLIIAWLLAFAIFAFLRSLLFGTPLEIALIPMSGTAFLLFTFYMISDPGTTPFPAVKQAIFGISVALVYHLLVGFHIVFGLFFALVIVCSIRGMMMYWRASQEKNISREKLQVISEEASS